MNSYSAGLETLTAPSWNKTFLETLMLAQLGNETTHVCET